MLLIITIVCADRPYLRLRFIMVRRGEEDIEMAVLVHFNWQRGSYCDISPIVKPITSSCPVPASESVSYSLGTEIAARTRVRELCQTTTGSQQNISVANIFPANSTSDSRQIPCHPRHDDAVLVTKSSNKIWATAMATKCCCCGGLVV